MVLTASAPTVMEMKNRTRSKDFRPGMGLREKDKEGRRKENVEGFVLKSKGFLPMNLSNPKGESFDAEGIDCGGGRRSKVVGLKEKIGRRLFSRYYSGLLQFV